MLAQCKAGLNGKGENTRRSLTRKRTGFSIMKMGALGFGQFPISASATSKALNKNKKTRPPVGRALIHQAENMQPCLY